MLRLPRLILLLACVALFPEEALAGSASVRARVSLDGDSAVGARVRILRSERLGKPLATLAESTVDSEGIVELEMPVPERPWPRRASEQPSLVIESPGLPPKVLPIPFHKFDNSYDAFGTLHLGEISIDRGCDLTGRVLARSHSTAPASGSPLSGALVVVWLEGFDSPWRAVTDAQGSFKMDMMPPAKFVVGLAHEDFVPRRTSVEHNCPEEAQQEFVIDRGLQLQGTVRHEDGRPAVGASVASLPVAPLGAPFGWLPHPIAGTHQDGAYTVGARDDDEWSLFAEAEGTLRKGTRTRSDRNLSEIADLVLKAKRRVRGTVEDESWPVEGALLGFAHLDDQAPPVRAESGPDGAFDSGALAAGRYLVTVESEEHETLQVELDLSADAPATLYAKLRTAGTGSMVVRVVDDNSHPVEGASVLAMDKFDRCTTDRSGECQLEGIPLGEELFVMTEHPAHDAVVRACQLPADRQVEIQFEESSREMVRLRGSVRGEDGEPVVGARVRLHEPYRPSGPRVQTVTDSRGSFVLPPVPEGFYALKIHARQMAPFGRGLKVLESESELEVVLSVGTRIEGTLEGVEGPMPSVVTIRAIDERGGEPAPCSSGSWFDSFPPSAQRAGTDPSIANAELAQGRYRFEHVPPGDWQILAVTADHTWSTVARIAEGERETWLPIEGLPRSRCPDHNDTVAAQANESLVFRLEAHDKAYLGDYFHFVLKDPGTGESYELRRLLRRWGGG